MNITYIHHSGFLVETERFYYLFDFETGSLPAMNAKKPIFVLSSHSHGDHYNPKVFTLLNAAGMEHITAILSDDIEAPASIPVLSVSPEKEYRLCQQLTLTTFRSTDLGVAFLIEDQGQLIYHAGDLNDWVWDEETEEYNREMTASYRRQIRLLAEKLRGREIDAAFVVLDPRQERDYARGMCYFLENIPANTVWPMHYWDDPGIIDTFLREYPHYSAKIRKTESK
jgi:L-ascorbate metabolism protein UlaG (beta-lactamase superfamily)